MDQIKIGKFIAECRKKNNLTQMQLAEKLNITDRAISKWENGKAMPDTSIMLDLCNELKINVNELLSGEMIEMKQLDKKTEELLLEMAKSEEMKNKKMITMMYVLGIFLVIFYLAFVGTIAYFLQENETLAAGIILPTTAVFIFACFFLGKMEVDAGYYECKECHHRHIPTYMQAIMAPHMGTTRYMRCPECGKKSWSKKVMTKE